MRHRVVLKSLGDVQLAAKTVPAAHVVRVKDRFANPAGGYRDMLYNIDLQGHVCELQVQLEAIQKVKSGDGHKLTTSPVLRYSSARLAHFSIIGAGARPRGTGSPPRASRVRYNSLLRSCCKMCGHHRCAEGVVPAWGPPPAAPAIGPVVRGRCCALLLVAAGLPAARSRGESTRLTRITGI